MHSFEMVFISLGHLLYCKLRLGGKYLYIRSDLADISMILSINGSLAVIGQI